MKFTPVYFCFSSLVKIRYVIGSEELIPFNQQQCLLETFLFNQPQFVLKMHILISHNLYS